VLTLFLWLRKSLGITSAATAVARLGHGGFDFEIVGEQSYQDRLRQISAGRVERGERVTFACHLRYENNSHTHRPAVRVDASGGRTVGHFPAEQAEVYAPAIYALEVAGQNAVCQGVLVGAQPGKPSFGVWLDFKPKLLGLRV
jgi:hypothetical protein